ncbi:MAG: type I methionyl aminopeptidase [Geminicoccaceae bacterium]|nr:MAG: type I methionyl aminopeptidase [Geminicoccaceae bacterium]
MNRNTARKLAQAVPLHGPAAFEGMRRAGRVAALILDQIGPHVAPGVTTAELDQRCHAATTALGATSATIGYRGYQHASCISLNHVVCHGIPSDRKLKDGDILNIDVTVIVDGWHGDSSRMYFAGNPPLKARRLCRITFEALWKGLNAIRPGATLGDLGHAIQSHAEAHRCSVVRDYCGHGIGRVFHDAPSVLHYGRPGEGLVLEPGMIFTVEPMINLGTFETKLLGDGWTVVTKDRQLSAQFEHTIGVTDTGCEVFTLSPAGLHHPDW